MFTAVPEACISVTNTVDGKEKENKKRDEVE
jgi:hypothetical protein